jgi:hypothetical protein
MAPSRSENERGAGTGYEAGVFLGEAPDPQGLGASHLKGGQRPVKCNVCEQEFANSEELKAHMERDHSIDERADDELEKPDMIQEEQQAAERMPGKE